MSYNPKADRFNPNAVRDALERHKARLRAACKEVPDTEKADSWPKSILDGLPRLLLLDSWRSASAIGFPGARGPVSPRQRPQ